MTQTYSAKNLAERYLSRIKKKYENADQDVAPELNKLTLTHPPSAFAFSVIFCYGLIIDIVNILVDVTLIVNLCIAILYFILLRAFINRSITTQKILASLLVLALVLEVLLPGLGTILALPLIAFVLLFGLRNPGVAISSVNKEKITNTISEFQKSIQIARGNAARIIKLGRSVRGLRAVTTKVARSKVFRAFSKNTKIMGRLLGSLVAESIVILDWLPLSTLNARWTYKQLKAGHKDAQELARDYYEARQLAEEFEVAVVQAQSINQVIGQIPVAPISKPISEAPKKPTTQLASKTPAQPRIQTQGSL